MINKKVENILEKLWPYIVFAIVAFILVSYQIQKHTTILVGDGFFHFSRFYDAAMQIKNHNFSYYQMNYGFNQTGRIINGLYSPFFAYLMGGLVLICKNWFNFQIVTTFLISFISAVGMYLCSKKVTNNTKISVLIGIIYMAQVKLWSNGSTFTSISSMLVPFVLLCGIRMVTDNDKPISWIQLALVMSIVSQIHVLSIILFVILLILFFIVGLIKANNKSRMWLDLLFAVLATLLLTANIWLSLFYSKFNENLFNPISANMAGTGISVRRFTILTVITFLLQIIYVVVNHKKSSLNVLMTSLAIIFWILSTKFFPWKIIQKMFPILKETFQYPRRISILFIPLILVGIAISANEIIKADNKNITLGIVVLLSLVFLSSYNRTLRLNSFYTVNTVMLNTKENHQQIAATKTKNLGQLFKNNIINAPDYLPKDKNISSKKAMRLYKRVLKKSKGKFKYKVLTKGRLRIAWRSNTNKKITLPLVMYNQSQLKLNKKLKNIVHKNAIGMPRVKQKIGKNSVVLSYKNTFLFKSAITITIISWLVVILLGIAFAIKRRSLSRVHG